MTSADAARTTRHTLLGVVRKEALLLAADAVCEGVAVCVEEVVGVDEGESAVVAAATMRSAFGWPLPQGTHKPVRGAFAEKYAIAHALSWYTVKLAEDVFDDVNLVEKAPM